MSSLSPYILEKLKRWKRDPLLFALECLHVTPSTQQIELLQSFAGCKRMTIRSGHGTGKDASASWIICWFLATRPYAKVICTAPTARQLADILWSEISKWMRQSAVADDFVIQKDKIYHKDAQKEWWARAVSTNTRASKEEQSETLAGFHGDHMLIVCDEASGIPDPVFIPLEGAMTQEDNKCLLIGNMTQSSGYFYESHFHSTISKRWNKLHWSSEKSSNVDPSYCEYMAEKYGIDSDVYRIRVLGDAPTEADDTLIPYSWALQCVGNALPREDSDPKYLGVDVARKGKDKSVILPRQGFIIDPWEEYQGMLSDNLMGRIRLKHADYGAEGIAIDEIGVGGPIIDTLSGIFKVPNVLGVNVASSSSDGSKFHRLRDEIWWMVRRNCEHGRYSFPDVVCSGGFGKNVIMGEVLAEELSSIKYTHKGSVLHVESKDDMKKRGKISPNIADALGITEVFATVARRIFTKKRKKEGRNPDIYPNARRGRRASWRTR